MMRGGAWDGKAGQGLELGGGERAGQMGRRGWGMRRAYLRCNSAGLPAARRAG